MNVQTERRSPVFVLLLMAALATVAFFALVSVDWSLIIPNGNGGNMNGNHVIHDELNQDLEEKSHAEFKHGTEAESVRNCLDKYGSIHIFFNPSTGRYSEVCYMEDGRYGIRFSEMVNGKMEEVTAFIKNQFKRWPQMAKYLENGGYTNMIK